MYKTVWNFMNHHVKSSHVSAMFLAALLAGWTLIGLLTGSVVCLISAISLFTKTVVLFCSAGYTGLISDSLEVSSICIKKLRLTKNPL